MSEIQDDNPGGSGPQDPGTTQGVYEDSDRMIRFLDYRGKESLVWSDSIGGFSFFGIREEGSKKLATLWGFKELCLSKRANTLLLEGAGLQDVFQGPMVTDPSFGFPETSTPTVVAGTHVPWKSRLVDIWLLQMCPDLTPEEHIQALDLGLNKALTIKL